MNDFPAPMRAKKDRDNRPVFYSEMPVDLEITDDDAANGTPKDPHTCAAAIACKRLFPMLVDVEVGRSRTFLYFDNHVLAFMTPPGLRKQTIVFDQGSSGFKAGNYRLGVIHTGKRERKAGTMSGKGNGNPRTVRTGVENVRPGLPH